MSDFSDKKESQIVLKTKRKNGFFKKVSDWLQGSIRRKLTIFVVLLAFFLVGLVWVFATKLMEPMYISYVRNDLETVMYGVNTVLTQAQDQGMTVVSYDEAANRYTINAEVLEMLQTAKNEGKIEQGEASIDIAGKDLKYIAGSPSPNGWVLHSQAQQYGGFSSGVEFDGALVTTVRILVQQNGYFYKTLSSGKMLVGMTTNVDGCTIIVSTNIEKIQQSVNVLKRLMIPILFILLIVSVVAAWFFSRWFTKPLSQLSAATKEMANGNYDITVKEVGDDEIAQLAHDFNTMAVEVNRSAELQRDLIANVSHDLRTPLTIIKGYAETVRDLTGDDPQKREEQLSVIINETDRLSGLVNSVMELSRMSSGHEKPVPVCFDLADLCDEVSFRYNEICRQSGYNFHFERENDCETYADPALMERALHNYLGNAIKHVGEDGYIGLKVSKTDRNTIRVEVNDHGPGVPAQDLPYLFDKYYRSRADEGKQGTGLGLSIAKAIFEANKCQFGIESEVGKGACFWFEAPAASEAAKMV